MECIRPVAEAVQAQLIKSNYKLDNKVWLGPTPGFITDHCAVHLPLKGLEAVIGDDLMHCPVRCLQPQWRAGPDFNPTLAPETRRSFMYKYAEIGTLFSIKHLILPYCGVVTTTTNTLNLFIIRCNGNVY